jgi:alpha-tubulin suppressor-like RCC1 family protein
MKTIHILVLLSCASAACQKTATPPACTGAACHPACTGAACTSSNRSAGLTWQVLSVARNAGGGSANSSTAPGDSPIPALRSNSIRQSLALGLNHTCALPNTGAHAGRVLCWGDDRAGQIGNGSAATSPVFAPAEVLGLPGDDVPLQIAAGDAHTCALLASGRIFCWGSNSHGQLGVDAAIFPSSPAATAVTGATARIFSQLAAGGDQTCALDTESHALCWGNNASGQLGIGTTVDSSVPMLVTVGGNPMPFGHITTSANHTCAAEGPDGGFHWGSVYCWGDDSHGQLANTSQATPLSARIFPAPVLALENTRYMTGLDGLQLIQRVSSGIQHSCGITIYGNYYCWGDNSQNQLGVIDPASASNPNARLNYNSSPPMYSSVSFGDPPGGTGQVTFTAGPVSYTSGSVTPASPQMVSGSSHVCT